LIWREAVCIGLGEEGLEQDGFVSWREDIGAVSFASAKLLKALEGCAFPARYSLGRLKTGNAETALYEHAVAVVTALIDATGQLAKARKMWMRGAYPILRPNSSSNWPSSFGTPANRGIELQSAVVSLTTIALDGIG
jgi:hypothetical protein